MGVLTCDRTGCSNIMCDRMSHTWGYLCDDCFDELVRRGVKTDIASFMDTTPDHDFAVEGADTFFTKIFPDRRTE